MKTQHAAQSCFEMFLVIAFWGPIVGVLGLGASKFMLNKLMCGYGGDFPEEIPEKTPNSPREYGWDPPSPIIQDI